MTEFKREIDINHIDTIDLSQLFGKLDENIKFLEDKFQVRIKLKEGYLLISGPSEENISKVEKHLKALFKVLKQQKSLSLRDVKYLVYQGEKNPEVDLNKRVCVLPFFVFVKEIGSLTNLSPTFKFVVTILE